MLTVVKIILEIIEKGYFTFNIISNLSEKKKIRRIGSDLFLFYLQLNEIIVCGEMILAYLNTFLIRYDKGKDFWQEPELRKILEVQCVNLEKFAESAARLSIQLKVLDVEAFQKLEFLIGGKKNLIDIMIDYINFHKDIPISSPNEENLKIIINEIGSITFDRFMKGYEKLFDISERLDRSPHGWNEEKYKALINYFNSREPEQQLVEIRQYAERFRESILLNFSLQDILIGVGDRRLEVDSESRGLMMAFPEWYD